ncbi:MAG: efflux RND transporter periplasmic adaptor subunit [Akkermansiaceae bacterium]|jgi:RND family efflux transporter MFP subunit
MSSNSSNRLPPLAFLALAAAVIATAWWGISALASAKPAESGGGNEAPGGPPPANVILAPIQSITSAQTHRVIGTLKAKSRSEIAAREAGAILEITVDEGDTVEKDAVIARIDSRRIEAQLSEARAEITVAEALVHQKKSRVKRSSIDLEMKEKLFASKAISESEVLDARSASNVDNSVYAATQDSLKAAQSRLELLSVRLQDLEIRAPFAGTVVSRHIELGEWAEPGASIVTLVSSGDIEAWLQVPERFSNSTRGQKVPVTITSTGQTIESTTLTLVPEAGTETRTLQMIATLPNPDNILVSGLSVTAEIPVSKNTDRLAVPVNAVVQGYAGPGIFVPTPQEGGLPVAKRIPVEVLFQDNELVYLNAEGLKAGDQVIVEGNERLFPFQPLIIGERNP